MKGKILFIFIVLNAWTVMKAQKAPDWYPKVDEPTATFINHDGEEEELVTGEVYDAPMSIIFSANPTDTLGYDVLYEWTISQIKNGIAYSPRHLK